MIASTSTAEFSSPLEGRPSARPAGGPGPHHIAVGALLDPSFRIAGSDHKPPEPRQVNRAFDQRHGDQRTGLTANRDRRGNGTKVFEIRGEALVVMVFRAVGPAKPFKAAHRPHAQVGMTEHCVDSGAAVAVRHREDLPGRA